MPSEESPCLLLDRRFADMDEYAEQVGWQLDFRQIDAGRLHARAAVLATSHGTSMRVELDRAFHQAGSPPRELLTFGLPDPEVGEFNWCSARAAGGDILNFNLASGFDGSSGAEFSGYTLSFTEEHLREVQTVLDLEFDLRGRVTECAVWTDVIHVTARLRRKLSAAYRATLGEAGDDSRAESLDFDAVSSLLQCLARKENRVALPGPSLRRKAVRNALELLEDHERCPPTVYELCRRTGVSAPTLYRGFHEEFGIGPKRYLQIRRLNGVYRALRRATRRTRIADLANDWGFWHMGQFAADYREHFGELPSETRRRATGEDQISGVHLGVHNPRTVEHSSYSSEREKGDESNKR